MSDRFDYVKYDDTATAQQAIAKTAVITHENVIEQNVKCGRSKAIAITKLEECYAWIGKGIRNDQLERNDTADLEEQRSFA